jgi:hypothetical protein
MKNIGPLQALRHRRSLLSSSTAPSKAIDPPGPPAPVSRRRFVRTSVGALAAGAAIGHELFRPTVAYAAGSDPIPVPGSPNLAPFHVWAPLVFDSIDAEPSTISNFNGVVGIAYVSGRVKRTNMLTGHVDDLPFNDADMRFMQGVYQGVDGKPRQGTFGFV